MKEYSQSEFLIETIVPEDELIISRTDLTGVITYANETFAYISGYTVDELVGKPHNLVRHPDMPKRVFTDMWKKLKNERKWQGYVKNIRKDGGFYWVYASVSAVFKDGKHIEYKSIRVPISFEDKLKHQKLYDEMRNIDNDNIRTISYK